MNHWQRLLCSTGKSEWTLIKYLSCLIFQAFETKSENIKNTSKLNSDFAHLYIRIFQGLTLLNHHNMFSIKENGTHFPLNIFEWSYRRRGENYANKWKATVLSYRYSQAEQRWEHLRPTPCRRWSEMLSVPLNGWYRPEEQINLKLNTLIKMWRHRWGNTHTSIMFPRHSGSPCWQVKGEFSDGSSYERERWYFYSYSRAIFTSLLSTFTSSVP